MGLRQHPQCAEDAWHDASVEQAFGSSADWRVGSLRSQGPVVSAAAQVFTAVKPHRPTPLVTSPTKSLRNYASTAPMRSRIVRKSRPEPGSVHDVERVAQGLIESGSGDLVEVADWFVVEIVEWDR